MKKIFIIAVIISIACFASAKSNEVTKKEVREIYKESKAFVKAQIKEGYSLIGSGKLENVVNRYLIDKYTTNSHEIYDTKTSNVESVAIEKLQNSIISRYAELSASKVKGRINTEISDITSNGIDNFYSAYERIINNTVDARALKGFMIRKVENGIYTVRGYFTIDEEYAHNAMLQALKEADIREEYARKISDYVNESFN